MSDLLSDASDMPTNPVDVMSVAPTASVNPYSSKLASSMNTDSTILQRMAELEKAVKDGFDKLSSMLSNTPIITGKKGGGRRKTRRERQMRSNKI